jgi:ketosteroid isomerase-like protein
MAVSHSVPVEQLRHAYQTWHDTKAENPDEFLKLCADQISFGSVMDALGDSTAEKVYSSKESLRAYLAGLRQAWEMIHFTMSDYIADGDRVVAFGSCAWRNRETNKTIETAKVDIWKFKDGRAVEVYEFFDTAKVRDAMTAS